MLYKSIVSYNISKENIKILQNYILNLNEIRGIFVSYYNIYEFKNSDKFDFDIQNIIKLETKYFKGINFMNYPTCVLI